MDLSKKGDLLEGGADTPRRQVKLWNRVSSWEVQGTLATCLLTSGSQSWDQLIAASALPQITSLKIQKGVGGNPIGPASPMPAPGKAIIPTLSGLCTFGGKPFLTMVSRCVSGERGDSAGQGRAMELTAARSVWSLFKLMSTCI